MASHWGNSPSKKERSLPTVSPAEVLSISPENLEVANCFLQNQTIAATAVALDIPTHEVSQILSRREVKAYVDNVFMDMGFNNRFRMRGLLDEIIAKKLEEMDTADIGSGKDIIDILAMSHKMTMELMQKEIDLEKARGTNVKNQTNVQINDTGVGGNLGGLLERLLKQDENN